MKILMVCLGNICRSPLAEELLRNKLKTHNLETKIIVDSAGISGFHAGQNPDPRSTTHAKHKGIDISKLISRQFTVQDFDIFDRIYVMDSNNYADVLSLSRNDADRKKVEYILNVSNPGGNNSVPDPYFGGDQGFENVFNLLNEACDLLISELRLSLKSK